METKLSIKFSIFLLLLALSSPQSCPSFNCNKLDDSKCLVPQLPSPVQSYSIQNCTLPNQYCPIQRSGETTQTLRCINKEDNKVYLYPGAPCNEDADCIGRLCKNNICQGTPVNEKCSHPSNCLYGYTCRKDDTSSDMKCLIPKNEAEVCERDTDCQSALGCLNKKCTKYYSLPDESQVPHPSMSPNLSFCQSGYDYKGVCKTLKNKGGPTVPCSGSSCSYIDSANKEINVEDSCECGYNPKGTRYCKLGSGELNYTKIVNLKKNLFINNPNCHLDERGVTCSRDLYNSTKEIRKKYQKYINSNVWAYYEHKLIDSQPCALSVFFPQYNATDEEPDVPPQCAKYKCQDAQPACAQSKSSQTSISVTLSDICEEEEYCSVGDEPNIAFYQGKDVTGTCLPVETNISAIRYPGEECSLDHDCEIPDITDPKIGKCRKRLCTGYKEGEECKSTAVCLSGLFCNRNSGKCEKQRGEGEACATSYDCQNKMVCYDGKCQAKFYSMPTGTKVLGRGDLSEEFYCEYGMAMSGECVKLSLASQISDSKFRLAKCELGKDCTYTVEPVKFPKIVKKCECGYNENGQAYCPKSHSEGKIKYPLYISIDSDQWKKYFSYLIQKYDNTCHTMTRFNCYKSDESVLFFIKTFENKLHKAHLYTSSVTCAQKVFSGINPNAKLKSLSFLSK